MKVSEIKCRICGAGLHECSGYLARVNEKGEPGAWECRPGCASPGMSNEEKLAEAMKEQPNVDGGE